MTQETIPTIEELQAEVARLKTHADDLLAERRAEKHRREELEAQLATLTGERDTLAASVESLTIDAPVLRALEHVVACPPEQGRKLLEAAGIGFRLGKDGTAVAVDGDAEIPLPDLHTHLRNRCDTPDGMTTFGWIIRGSGASGSGATGGYQPGSQRKPASTSKPVATGLGLR